MRSGTWASSERPGPGGQMRSDTAGHGDSEPRPLVGLFVCPWRGLGLAVGEFCGVRLCEGGRSKMRLAAGRWVASEKVWQDKRDYFGRLFGQSCKSEVAGNRALPTISFSFSVLF